MKKTILLLIPALLSACSSHKEDMADAYADSDKLSAAHNPNAMLRIAESMRNAGNYEMAIKSYDQAIQLDPTMTVAYIGLSFCLRKTGRFDAAIQTLNSVPIDMKNTQWYKELGSVHTASFKPKKCVDAYQKAYEGDPKDVAAMNGMGVCYDLMGQHNEAQKWYNSALALAPANNMLKSNMGLSLALSNKTQEAINILTSVVEGGDSTSRDRQNLAIAYGLSGDLDQAVKYFSQDLDQSQVRTNLAFLHKLASSQHLTPEQKAASVMKGHSFESNLVAESTAAPAQTNAQPEISSSVDAISKDSHVIIQPLPTAEPDEHIVIKDIHPVNYDEPETKPEEMKIPEKEVSSNLPKKKTKTVTKVKKAEKKPKVAAKEAKITPAKKQSSEKLLAKKAVKK